MSKCVTKALTLLTQFFPVVETTMEKVNFNPKLAFALYRIDKCLVAVFHIDGELVTVCERLPYGEFHQYCLDISNSLKERLSVGTQPLCGDDISVLMSNAYAVDGKPELAYVDHDKKLVLAKFIDRTEHITFVGTMRAINDKGLFLNVIRSTSIHAQAQLTSVSSFRLGRGSIVSEEAMMVFLNNARNEYIRAWDISNTNQRFTIVGEIPKPFNQ